FMVETGSLDPRLEKIDLSNPHAVFVALGGQEDYIGKFDSQAYFSLPIGQRLLTLAELDALAEGDKRPEPEIGDRDFPRWYMMCVHQDNGGGVNPWRYNWDPEKRQEVYYDEADIPEEMVDEAYRFAGPEELARRARMKIELLDAFIDILRYPPDASK
ncbi:MAG: hypothetical protein NT149_03440, partial [Candidatus Gottesmanbacteria bacterium]|nr:hypothetical protein [Candidatus Gottesmanbacteria bacterium]